ncbi:MAG: Holliday junction branch migration protein RuvA [Candidatus Marinimicrobia bacterium CG08_land_8_20_14_0_20_45_22]|nr:MAG: Holliday junction branch migration protein RuvA [Candidatus Marinimicrobia bacterium CG08_land_8_20_14_0_20_45_22]
MFAYLKGILEHKEPTMVILDVNGVGYQLTIPLSTYEFLPAPHQMAKLLTYFHVREDVQALYGFATDDERNLFLMLIGISGIGPKMAITILSGASPEQFKRRIISGDVKALTLIPGIGLKTAKRIIIELRGKLVGKDETVPEETDEFYTGQDRDEALKALLSLGYRRSEALNALKKAHQQIGETGTVEQYVKVALNKM